MKFSRRRLLASLLLAPAVRMRAQEPGEILTKDEEARLKKFLPRTLGKMLRREPVYVAVCGDEISAFSEPGSSNRPSAHVMAWYGRFLDRLGSPFFYHGGVMDLTPTAPAADKELEAKWEEYRKLRAEWEKLKSGDPPKIPGIPGDPSGLPPEFGVNDLLRMSRPPGRVVPLTTAFYASNYATDGAVSVQVFDPLLSLVFHTEEKAATDLVVIAYGARDALEGQSLATFRTVLESALAECRKKGADVILAGPPPALDEADERAAIGRARPWAAVMREVAEAAGIFFADLGAAAMDQPSDLLNRTPESTFRASIEPVRKMFDHGGRLQDGFHPNGAAHRRMGERIADWLRHGEPVRPFDISGELDTTAGPVGEAILTIRIAPKQTDPPLTVAVCPLRFTGWMVKPGSADKVHTFQPDRGARLFRYAMVPADEPLPGREEFIRGSVIISDDSVQHLADVKVKVLPLMLLWPEERADNASGEHVLKATLVNTGRDSLNVELTLDWMGQQTPLPAVTVGSGQQQALAVRLPLPPVDGFRFRQTAALIASAEGRKWKFIRRVEGVRHTGLNQKLPLVPLASWKGRAKPDDAAAAAAGIQATVSADTKGVYFQVDVPAQVVSDLVEGKPWGRLEVQIDGRNAAENGKLGCVGILAMELPRGDGAGRLLPVRPAVFGNGYAYPYEAKGFRTLVGTRPDGSRRVQFNMARAFLVHHGWSLDGTGQSDLGINLRLMLIDGNTGGFSDAKTFVLTASSFAAADARSLTLLELRGTPAARWSLRIG